MEKLVVRHGPYTGKFIALFGKNIKDQLVLVATDIPAPKNALRLYRKRWGIECLFADAKTRGINIEDTHMTDHSKITISFTKVTLSMV